MRNAHAVIRKIPCDFRAPPSIDRAELVSPFKKDKQISRFVLTNLFKPTSRVSCVSAAMSSSFRLPAVRPGEYLERPFRVWLMEQSVWFMPSGDPVDLPSISRYSDPAPVLEDLKDARAMFAYMIDPFWTHQSAGRDPAWVFPIIHVLKVRDREQEIGLHLANQIGVEVMSARIIESRLKEDDIWS